MADISSVFHRGELAVQQRVGVADKVAEFGKKAIRNFMPEQHREFFAQLPMLLVGSTDQHGQPWASVLCAAPGFVQSPQPGQLLVQVLPKSSDPLSSNLQRGTGLGVLGIELPTRRRNRMNGQVSAVNDSGFAIQVRQSFGNCPKYIQTRTPEFVSEPPGALSIQHSERLTPRMQAMIAQADTYFIASAHPNPADDSCAYDVDVSHRGGKPGFVRIDSNNELLAPEFVGNYYFNTTGNLLDYPRAGLLFIDFACGDVLYLAVEAEIVWEGDDLIAFAGAQRLLRYRIRQARLALASLPLRWGASSMSPFLEATGSWG
jgi:predicted pyridoxine 5'-phosphate oxidase superfamily flavin-nucleotide-binding protein